MPNAADYLEARFFVDIPYRKAGSIEGYDEQEAPTTDFVRRLLPILDANYCNDPEVQFSIADSYPIISFWCDTVSDAAEYCNDVFKFLEENGYEPV